MDKIFEKFEIIKNKIFSLFSSEDENKYKKCKDVIDDVSKNDSDLNDEDINKVEEVVFTDLNRNDAGVLTANEVSKKIYDIYLEKGYNKVFCKLVSILFLLTSLRFFLRRKLTNLQVNEILEEVENHPTKFFLKKTLRLLMNILIPFKLHRYYKLSNKLAKKFYGNNVTIDDAEKMSDYDDEYNDDNYSSDIDDYVTESIDYDRINTKLGFRLFENGSQFKAALIVLALCIFYTIYLFSTGRMVK